MVESAPFKQMILSAEEEKKPKKRGRKPKEKV